MDRLFIFLIYSAFFMLWPLLGQAKATYLFVGTEFPLILEQGKNGHPQGVAVDLLKRIEQLTGEKIGIHIMPWTRALNRVKTGEATALIGPYYSEKRAQYLSYCDVPFYDDHMVFLKKKSLTFTWKGDFQSLKRYRVLTVKSWSYGKLFDENRQHMHLAQTLAASNGIKMLMKGRVDLLAFNKRNALAEIRKQGLTDKIEILEPAFSKRLGFFAFSRQHSAPEFEKAFGLAMKQLEEAGVIHDMNARYGLNIRNREDMDIKLTR